MRELDMAKDFTVYTEGLCYASVCSSLPQAVVEARMRERNTNIESGWKLSKDKFNSGESNPCACNMNQETHKHYLFNC